MNYDSESIGARQPAVKRRRSKVLPQNEPETGVSRKFTGIWIPAALWLRRDLTWFQKCLLAEIASLGECFASNDYLAKAMGTSAGVIANEISRLRKMELVIDMGFDGRQRRVVIARNVHPNPFGEPFEASHRSEGSLHTSMHIDTSKNIESEEAEEDIIKDDEGDFPVKWKPMGSKEEQLKRIRTPENFPSQSEFHSFLKREGLDNIIMTYREDIYDRLSNDKWHQWRPKFNHWKKIYNWKEYVRKLAEKIVESRSS